MTAGFSFTFLIIILRAHCTWLTCQGRISCGFMNFPLAYDQTVCTFVFFFPSFVRCLIMSQRTLGNSFAFSAIAACRLNIFFLTKNKCCFFFLHLIWNFFSQFKKKKSVQVFFMAVNTLLCVHIYKYKVKNVPVNLKWVKMTKNSINVNNVSYFPLAVCWPASFFQELGSAHWNTVLDQHLHCCLFIWSALI